MNPIDNKLTDYMPYKEKPIMKQKYTIGEAAKELGVLTSKIRFWCNDPDDDGWKDIAPNVARNAKGDRIFKAKDIDRLRLIKEYSEASHKKRFEAYIAGR